MPTISKSIASLVTTDDGEITIMGTYVDRANEIAKVSKARVSGENGPVIRVKMVDGDVMYVYQGNRIEADSYGVDARGFSATTTWNGCETVQDAVDELD